MDCLKPKSNKKVGLFLRVNPDVKTQILTLVEKSNLSFTEYAIWSMLNSNKPVYTIDRNALMDIQLELARQGNNLNQIAHALNYIISRTMPPADQEHAIEVVLGEINLEHEKVIEAVNTVLDLQQKVYKTTLLSIKT